MNNCDGGGGGVYTNVDELMREESAVAEMRRRHSGALNGLLQNKAFAIIPEEDEDQASSYSHHFQKVS